MNKSDRDTSWETSSSWYDKIVGEKGHYYHQQVILPRVVRFLGKEPFHVLDLACGQGILSRHLPKGAKYLGLDGSPSLIKAATSYPHPSSHRFSVHDLMHPLEHSFKEFTHATCILAVQNLSDPLPLFHSAHDHLQSQGTFILVLNHPCFRIPRQSGWGVDAQKKLQYRRIDRYMTPLSIPIQTSPGKGKTEETISFHFSLSHYTALLKKAGFTIDSIEEWCSDKRSTGKTAAMENRSRQEFPLFLAIIAIKR